MSISGGYKCYNIYCGSCMAKTLCGEPADSALGCNDRIFKSETNTYQKVHIDREEWEPCELCEKQRKVFNEKFCGECGRPLTEEAWEALEKRLKVKWLKQTAE